MKKIYGCSLLALIIFFCAGSADAQSKVIRKVIKKVITPQISPVTPPRTEPNQEVVPDLPPPPTPEVFIPAPKEYKGLFGWGLNTDLAGKLLAGSVLAGVRGDLIFADPFKSGEKFGLAEDAIEYKVGLGYVMSDKLNSLPLFADTVVYLKEGTLFGMNPYFGVGLIYNLIGSGISGGLGGQIYLGVLANLGFESETGFALGYANYNVGDRLSDRGIFFSVAQPIKL
jgi:hypothetical protein